MPSVTYITNIPAGGDNPSNSQPDLQTNCNGVETILNQDLYGFNNANGGLHQRVTLPLPTTPGAQTDPQSIIHSLLGTGGVYTNYSLPFFANQSGDLPMLPDLSVTGSNYSFKLGNLIFNLGRAEILSGTQTIGVTWKVAFPVGPIMILCSKDGNGLGSSGDVLTISGQGNTTTGTFRTSSVLSSGNLPLYYLAIGY